MTTWHRYLLASAFALCTQAALAFEVESFNVLGCTFNGNVTSFTTCIGNKMTKAVNDAKRTLQDSYEDTIEALETSPFMAQIDTEKELLRIARDSGVVELNTCLTAAGANLPEVMNTVASNPMGVASDRLQQLLTAFRAEGTEAFAATVSSKPGGGLPAMSEQIERAYEQLQRLAATDPLANCLLPLLNNQKALLKSTSAAVLQQVQGQLQTIQTDIVEPEVMRRMQGLVSTLLQDLGVTAQQPIPRQQNRRRSTSAPQAAAAGAISAATQNRAARSSAALPLAQLNASAPAAFANDAVTAVQSGIAAATPSVRAMIESSLPNEVQRIALAEFTGIALAPRTLSLAADELNQIADGGDASNRAHLENLLQQLQLSNETMYTRIALATIRFYGHKVVDEAGYPMVDYLWGTVAGVEAVADNVVGVVCVAGYYVSGLPCNAIKGVVSFLVHSALVTSVTKATVVVMHEAWDRTVACGASAIAGAPADSACTALSPMLAGFPKTTQQAVSFIMPHLDATQRALFDYQSAVLKVASASTASRPGLR